MGSRYVEGFLAGQAVAYCEAIKFGSRVAGQIACHKRYARQLTRLIESEQCLYSVQRIANDRLAIWIYRDQVVRRLIDRLQSEPTSELAVWSMGKLFGYPDHDVIRYIARSM